jgi:DHA1 family quinolone resistance protein-like MFS transporter
VVLIGIELFFASMFALVGPFVAVFISQSIAGPTMLIVGTATTLFLITKSALQIPFSRFVDRAPSENFIVGILSGGYAIIALAPFTLALSTSAWQVLFSQFLLGIGSALTYPSWNALFTHHIDSEQAAFEWSVYDTIIGFSAAAASALGGIVIHRMGFRFAYVVVGVIILVSSFLPLLFYRHLSRGHTHGA